MKLILLSLALCSILVSSAYSQPPVFFGIRGGANFTHANSDAFTAKSNLGWEVGPYLGVNFVKPLGLQVEALYTWARLTTYQYGGPNGIGDGKKRLNYLCIPILVRLNLGPGFSLNAGPQLNLLTDPDKYKLNNNQPAFEKRCASWVLGFEIQSPGPHSVRIYGRAIWGDGVEKIGDGKNATVSRLQIGIFAPIIGGRK